MQSENTPQHFTDTESISEALVSFCRYARECGMHVGLKETEAAIKASDLGMIKDENLFKNALRSILCSSKEETDRFKTIFKTFWETTPRIKYVSKIKTSVGLYAQEKPGALIMLGEKSKHTREVENEEGKEMMGASAEEKLRQTDFTKVSDADTRYLEKLAFKLWQEMSLRLSRRHRLAKGAGPLHFRNTIRRSISYGGEPVQLIYKRRKNRKPRLVLFLDVSGSMDKYSFYLLRFTCILQKHFSSLETFIFSTSLLRITGIIREKDLKESLRALSAQVDQWSSGTRIGDCLGDFNREFARQVLHGNTTVIVLSDGLDTGDPQNLAKALRKISLRAKKLIWLNPLKGMKNYRPEARGMKTALPYIDIFKSGHNLESLLALENYLKNV